MSVQVVNELSDFTIRHYNGSIIQINCEDLRYILRQAQDTDGIEKSYYDQTNNLIFDLQKKSNFLGLHKSYLTIFYYQNGEKVFEKAINPEEANNELFELQIRLNEIKE